MSIEPYLGSPDINRLLSAFKREPVDRVPNFEVLYEDKHVERLLGRYAGNTLAIGGDPAKGIEEAKESRPMHPKDYIELCNMIGQDAMVIWAGWIPFKKYDEYDNLILISDRSIKTKKDWEKVVYPNDTDIETILFYIREYKEAMKGTKLGLSVLFGGLMEIFYEFIVGMHDFLLLVHDDIDFVEEMLEVATQYLEKMCNAFLNEGVDFIYVGDDIAFKSGLLIQPKIIKDIWIPRMAGVIKPAVERKVPILFHSDGKIDDIVPWLIEIGVDCINPLDPYSINYKDYKKKYGDMVSLCGNIDIEFPLVKGTPIDVEKDVKEHMEVLKPGYGYICSSSHSIVNYIPYENFITMINAIHKYGVY